MENKRKFKKNGMAALIGSIAVIILSVLGIIFSAIWLESEIIGNGVFGVILTVSIIVLTIACVAFAGLKSIKPNEALVLTLFGNFYGVIQEPGF